MQKTMCMSCKNSHGDVNFPTNFETFCRFFLPIFRRFSNNFPTILTIPVFCYCIFFGRALLKKDALRVPPAVTRLTVYRRLQVPGSALRRKVVNICSCETELAGTLRSTTSRVVRWARCRSVPQSRLATRFTSK